MVKDLISQLDRIEGDETLRKTKVQAEEEKKLAVFQAHEQAMKDLFSYVTHTIHNALGTAPEALREAIATFKGEFYDRGNLAYRAINNVAQVSSTIAFIESLIQNFKLFTSDPEKVRAAWIDDREGDATVPLVLALACRQSLARVIFSANYLGQLQRLIRRSDKDAIRSVRKSFLDEVMAIEITPSNSHVVLAWVQSHLPGVRIVVDADSCGTFKTNSIRFTILFSGFAELLHNAVKYADGEAPIEITWIRESDNWVFRVRNGRSADQAESMKGMAWSKNGLSFIHRIMGFLNGARLEIPPETGKYIAELRFGPMAFKCLTGAGQ